MFIIDANGNRITITNLQAAIDQTRILIGYFQTDERFRDFEAIQKAYWLDVMYKLLELAKLN